MLRRALKTFFSALLALVILFEEWGWEPLARALAALGRLPILRQIERGIQRLPPYAALAAFFLPVLAFLPLKILALWLLATGRGILGVMFLVAAKIAGTAIVARLFVLTKPALLRLAWFSRLYQRWTTWKDALIARVRASALWQAARRAKARARAVLRRVRAALVALSSR